MKLIKNKVIGIGLILAALSFSSYGTVLHKERTEQTITKGAVLIKEQVLTHEGWQHINILKINLQDENIKLKPIESLTLGERRTILDLAASSGAVAGINADFFDMATNNTPSFGPVISEGTLKHAYNSNYVNLGPARNMATFLLDAQSNPLMDYYGTATVLYANGNPIGGMASYNNIPTTLGRPIVLDDTYQKDTSKVLARFKGVYTIVIENGQVSYLSQQDEAVTIPRGGYAVLINANDANAYYGQFPIGTMAEIKNTVYLNGTMTDAVENIRLGLGGSGLIIKDGQEYTGAAHRVTPGTRAPRTVVATLKNSNELLLIAIDGRNKTLGANHKDLVQLLLSYGVKDAMYFDGGGSTTLVSRSEAGSELKVQNRPSDGTERKVVNGLGVFTTSQPDSVNRLYLDTAMNRTFVGESITFNVKGVDKNYNPVSIPKESISLTLSGVSGSFKGLTFYPETAGKALVIASYNGVEVAKEIYITDKPLGLRIEPSNLQISANDSKTVQIYGIDREGYKIPLAADKITWQSSNTGVSANGNRVIAAGKNMAELTASYKGVSGKMGVIVGDTAIPLESFEKNTAQWGGDTSTVKGKVEPSKELKYHGNLAVKMTYTFAKSPNKQIAYAVFNQPIELPSDALSLNLWLHAKKQGDTAKIEVIDAKGTKFYLKAADSLNFEGWRYLSVPLPNNMVFPAQVTKFYAFANSTAEKRTSAVYLDHISMTRGFRNRQGMTLRDDYRLDAFYKDSLQPATGNQYMFNIIGATKTSSMLLSSEAAARIGKSLSEGAGMVIMAAQSNLDLPISVPKHIYNNAYQVVDYSTTRIIFAGTDKGGIRLTAPNAWLSLKKDIESSSAKNIILVMSRNPLTQFDDTEEGLALHRYLKGQRESSGKNIFVVYSGGTEKEVYIEDGIRYIRNNGLNVTTDNVQDTEYIKFKVVGSDIYYTFESLK